MEFIGSSSAIIAVALVIWFLTSKGTRKSVGSSLVEVALMSEQSLKIARASSFNEAKAELGDLVAMLNESDAFLNQSERATTAPVPNVK